MTQCETADKLQLSDEQKVNILAAMAQITRLRVLRLLQQADEEGMIAGVIAKELSVPHNTLSTHLAILARAGLIRQQKQGRTIRYFARQDNILHLATSLMQDCCHLPEAEQRLVNEEKITS
ncbi:MAG: helix-turn-helix domain-containing protein [Cohaesibacter sp.]|nr:helix-turn-helix domain-containing protein [Cohaesibacter sp.]MCV6600468.1 helix-turn-helix domain-containing protein [Cohaesibacter sp.]